MQIINLYKYNDTNGVVITPIQRNQIDLPYCYRVIADEGHILINGTSETPCIDTHTPEEWYEIEADNIEGGNEQWEFQ